MTHVTIFKYLDSIVGFMSKGHADSEDSLGSVVCNGISSLTLTAILSLRDVAHIPEGDMEIQQEDGYLYMSIRNQGYLDERAQIILQSMEIGLRAIQENYKEYIKLKIQEVNDDSF